MCNQDNCPHENQGIIITDRDIMIGKAFMATMFMRVIKGLENNHDSADWMIQAGACAIDCTNEDCGTSRTMLAALEQAIDHVDNGADLVITDLYNKAGLLSDGKALTAADRLALMFKRAGIDLGESPDESDEGFIDTIIVDTVPAFLDASDDITVEVGRMVGADRGRTPSILVPGSRRATEQLH